VDQIIGSNIRLKMCNQGTYCYRFVGDQQLKRGLSERGPPQQAICSKSMDMGHPLAFSSFLHQFHGLRMCRTVRRMIDARTIGVDENGLRVLGERRRNVAK
jgi:hypothetical protein